MNEAGEAEDGGLPRQQVRQMGDEQRLPEQNVDPDHRQHRNVDREGEPSQPLWKPDLG